MNIEIEIESLMKINNRSETINHIIKTYENFNKIKKENLNLNLIDVKNIEYDINKVNKIKNQKDIIILEGELLKNKLEKNKKYIFKIDINKIKKTRTWYEITYRKLTKVLDNYSSSKIEDVEERCLKAFNIEKEKYDCDLERTLLTILKTMYKNKEINFLNSGIYAIVDNYEDTPLNRNIVKEISTFFDLVIEKKKKRNEKIYDYLYTYLDNDMKLLDYCDFKNNKCVAKRDEKNLTGYPTHAMNGCCYTYGSNKPCKYLKKDYSCYISCIACKIFLCKYLKERAIDYNYFDNIQFRMFLGRIQRGILTWNFFTPNKKIVKKMNIGLVRNKR